MAPTIFSDHSCSEVHMSSQESHHREHRSDPDGVGSSNRAIAICFTVGVGVMLLIMLLPALDRL